ncbi:sugar transferase [Macrococcus brunensis]|uniref:sugar transferase n=1 Tax=Macrococcus brunensis TaxID=198483 RepID=UPI001EF01963|nr:sugar transferase [Macrococcus brunensis]ULG74952.1 sugar transferase [Macrococcus brunensis]
MYANFLKRPLGLLISLLLLIMLWPVMLIISILVLKYHGRPILFKQKRPGKNGKIFNMYKFRTMTNEKDKEGNLLPDEQRLTTFGTMLRRTSLDELPELFNIVKGEMSFVGPRPLLIKYLPYYSDIESRRHDVRPGLTGLAQVNGRNLLSWDKRLMLDVEYVENISFSNDLKILLKTIGKVVKQEDIVEGNNHILQDLDIERQ